MVYWPGVPVTSALPEPIVERPCKAACKMGAAVAGVALGPVVAMVTVPVPVWFVTVGLSGRTLRSAKKSRMGRRQARVLMNREHMGLWICAGLLQLLDAS